MTTAINIDSTRALSLLQRAVDERGADYVYKHPTKYVRSDNGDQPYALKGCFYTVDNRPSCGVGLALSYEGVPAEVLDAMDQAPSDTSIQAVDYILRDHGVRMTQEALNVFSRFQKSQDLKTPWGEALNAAKEAVK